MKKFNRQIGGSGEEVAARYLAARGYKVLARNYSTKWGELDLVVKMNDRIVFVEVKSKQGNRYGSPWEMVNRNKLERVRRMGWLFLVKNGLINSPCRIDVVGVVFGEDARAAVSHWENVT